MRNIRPYMAMAGAFAASLVVFVASVSGATAAEGAEIVVSAAASLTDAFRDIGRAFEASHGGTTVKFNFAATDVLLTQIEKGAPADVFAAADEPSMNRAEREGLLASGSRRDFATNRLVLIVPHGAAGVTKLDELAQPRFARIALGSPRTVPAGRYAKAALDWAELWNELESKCVFALNVRQVLDYVARGEANAGFVYATDAAIMRDKVKIALDVAPVTPVRYPVAVVRASRHQAEARAFVEALTSDPAGKILAAYGFGLP